MPLKKGSRKAAISFNIRELVDAFKKKGKIGNVKPESFAKARSIAAAVAFKKAREED